MQQKNLALFIALCVLVLFGWPLLRQQLFPIPQPNEGQKTARLPPEGVRRDLLAGLSNIPGPTAPGVANAIGLVGAKFASLPRKTELAARPVPRETLERLGSALAASLPGLDGFGLLRWRPESRPQK